MTVYGGPDIVTDGLVLHLDAANRKSYPGSGNTWYDLSGNSLDLTKVGSPTHGFYAGTTCWRFTTNGHCFSRTGGMSSVLNGSNVSLEAVIYPETDITSGDRATIIISQGPNGFYHSLNKSNRKISNYWYNKNPVGYHETGAAISNNKWHYTTSVWNASDGKLYQYLNTAKTSINTTGTNALISDNLNIGRENSNRQFSGAIALIRIYNTPLTDSQILQNYNALKGRFGL